jgi:hypothetical protein
MLSRIIYHIGLYARREGFCPAQSSFMALQVLFELSGLNELKPVTTAARKLSNEENKLFAKTFVKIIFGIFIFMGIGFVYAAWDTPFPDMSTTRFCLEMCIIGLGAAIPSIMVTKDRGGSGGEVFTNFSSMFILFGLVAHPLMQYSGVYHELGFWKTPILATQSMGVGAS